MSAVERAKWAPHSEMPYASKLILREENCRVCGQTVRVGESVLRRSLSIEVAHDRCGWINSAERIVLETAAKGELVMCSDDRSSMRDIGYLRENYVRRAGKVVCLLEVTKAGHRALDRSL